MPLAEIAFHIFGRPVTWGEIAYLLAALSVLGLLAIWQSRRQK